MTFIYHGSKILIEQLIPMQATGFGGKVDCQSGVYGVKNKNLAIPFTFHLTNISEKSIFKVDTETKPPAISLINCNIDWSRNGYLYKLAPDAFEQLDKYQWVSRAPVEPIEVIKINPQNYKHWLKVVTT